MTPRLLDPDTRPMTVVDTTLRCSFCGKDNQQVAKLIAGPGVSICDECVELCDRILASARPSA